MKVLFVLVLSFVWVHVHSQYVIEQEYHFQDMAHVSLMNVPGEGDFWGGFSLTSNEFILFNEDFSIRSVFPSIFDPEEGELVKAEIIKYMDDESNALFLVYQYRTEQVYSTIVVVDEEGEQRLQMNLPKSFFWEQVGEREAWLTFNYSFPSETVTIIKQGTNFATEQWPFLSLSWSFSDQQLRFWAMNTSHQLLSMNENFEVVEIIDLGLENHDILETNYLGDFNIDPCQDEQSTFLFKTRLPELLPGTFRPLMNIVVNTNGEHLLTFEENFRFSRIKGHPTMLIVDHGLDGVFDFYTLPEMHFEASINGNIVQRLPLTSSESVYVSYLMDIHELDLKLYRKVDDEVVFWKNFLVPDTDQRHLYTLHSVTEDFFNQDGSLELMFSYMSQEPGNTGVKYEVITEFNEVLFEGEANNRGKVFFGTPGQDNWFMMYTYTFAGTGARNVKVFTLLDSRKEPEIAPLPLEEMDLIQIAPNPTEGKVQVAWNEGTEEITKIELYDAAGKLVQEGFELFCDSPFAIVDLSELSEGLYVFHISSNQKHQNVPVIKR